MNGETFYNVFSLGGLTFINPFSCWAPQRWADSPALTLPWPTVAPLQPITHRQEAENDSKIGSGQHSTNMCFQTSREAAQIPKYTQTLLSLSLVQRVCFCSYTELMLSLCTPLMYSLFCNKAGTMNTVESIWKAQHVMPGVDVIHEISEMHELLGSFHLFHSWKQVL